MTDDNDSDDMTNTLPPGLARLLGMGPAPKPPTLQDILDGASKGGACDCTTCTWMRDLSRRVAQFVADTPALGADEGEPTPTQADNDRSAIRAVLGLLVRRLIANGDDGLLMVAAIAKEAVHTQDLLRNQAMTPPEGKQVTPGLAAGRA